MRRAPGWRLGVLGAALAGAVTASGCASIASFSMPTLPGITLPEGPSMPSWVPLLGKRAEPEAPVPQSGPADLAATRERIPEDDTMVDRVICVVNNDAITMHELNEVEAAYYYENRGTAPRDEAGRRELRERLLDTIVQSRIQLQQAEREKILVDDGELTAEMNEIMKKVGADNQAAFERMVIAQGLTLERFRKRLREQLMVQRLTRRKVVLRISVTEREIDRYLAENREKLETGLTFEARHILFMPVAGLGDAGWEQARQKAEQIHGLALNGHTFDELAREHSEDGSGKDGGSLGVLKRGELAPEIEQAILALEPGEVSAPFRSSVGYHLFRLDSRQSLTGEGLTQARNQIRDILYRQKYEARLKEWLSEIRQRAVVDVRL
jgi:peptidyl-prolyl cis-trans isomerase SurA